jgi:predicted transcriptional regulator
MSKLEFIIGKSDDGEIVAKVDAALATAARGEPIEAKRTIRFENWSTFFRLMTANRAAILEFVAAQDDGQVRSTRALALALGRDYAAVHADVAELVELGLLERDGNALRCEVEAGAAIHA